MENKYPKQLIEHTKELYGKHSPFKLSDSDAVECIDNMSELLNYLAVLNEKYFPKNNPEQAKTTVEYLTKPINYIKIPTNQEQEKE